jgi:hypothetical protein
MTIVTQTATWQDEAARCPEMPSAQQGQNNLGGTVCGLSPRSSSRHGAVQPPRPCHDFKRFRRRIMSDGQTLSP